MLWMDVSRALAVAGGVVLPVLLLGVGGRWRRLRLALALALIGDVLVTAGCLGLPRAPISVWSSGVIGRVKGLGLDLLSGRLSR